MSGAVTRKVQQKVDTQLLLPLLCATLSESHPCVGVAVRVSMTAVTHRQVESQDRGQLDIVLALVLCSPGLRVHLALQHHSIH